MLSPFPGMDPFLEHPQFFPGLRFCLVVHLREVLQANLPEPYFADIRHRVWIEPDRTDAGEEVTESFVEIRTVQQDHPLVTVIEVLSPTNKTPGLHGRTHYLQKQEGLLKSRVNLVEIDLLRSGQHTTAVTYNLALAQAGPFDYHMCVRKMDELRRYFVYSIRLTDRLPELSIPLLPGDPDVKLDFQAVFQRCYDTGPYRRATSYRGPIPEPPLTAEQIAWVEALLREKGFLPAS